MFRESHAGCEPKARCLVVPEEEALRMQWLNDRVDSVTGYYNDYRRSLHSKYQLSEQEWEFDIGRGQFVRKQMA